MEEEDAGSVTAVPGEEISRAAVPGSRKMPLPSPENYDGPCCRLRWLPGCRRTGSETVAIRFSHSPSVLGCISMLACRARSSQLLRFASSVSNLCFESLTAVYAAAKMCGAVL
ncbi:uncharacterized protein DS421_11g334540 [Arachis hypogaea]|nr:uncharacterized protein DS421_11g334540 [Arachis hypogaea]